MWKGHGSNYVILIKAKLWRNRSVVAEGWTGTIQRIFRENALYDILMIDTLSKPTKCIPPRMNPQFTQLCLTLCHPMNRSTPGLPVPHQLPEFTQTHVHQVSDAIQPSHPLSSPSSPALNLSQHQGLFKWVSSLHQVAKVLKFQLQHQSFQWTFRTDLL